MKIDPEIAGRSIAYPELIRLIEISRQSDTRKRDMVSAVNRVLKMGGVWGGTFVFTVESLRILIASIKPAAHGVSPKSFANIQSNLRAALREAGIIAAVRGHRTKRDPHWSPLLQAVREDKTLLGLSRFINYCAEQSVLPGAVNDDTVLGFRGWLQVRTTEPRPDKVARTIPRLWNRASERVAGWPATRLKELQVGIQPRKTAWADLPDALRREAEAYLAMRANPDIFDESPGAPVRPLAQSTLRLAARTDQAGLRCGQPERHPCRNAGRSRCPAELHDRLAPLSRRNDHEAKRLCDRDRQDADCGRKAPRPGRARRACPPQEACRKAACRAFRPDGQKQGRSSKPFATRRCWEHLSASPHVCSLKPQRRLAHGLSAHAVAHSRPRHRLAAHCADASAEPGGTELAPSCQGVPWTSRSFDAAHPGYGDQDKAS